MKLLRSFLLVQCVLLSAAMGGVEIKYQVEQKNADSPNRQTLKVSGGLLRMDREGEEAYTIFRGDRQALWHVEPKKKSYIEMTSEDLAAVGEKISEAMKKMEQQLAKMPPQQRQMMEQMMADRMPERKDVKPVVARTGRKKKISGYNCVEYEIKQDGRKKAELWVTDLADTPLTQKDFKVFEDMAAFVNEMLKNMPMDVSPAQGFGYEQIKGLPIHSLHYKDGKLASEALCTGITEKDIPGSRFTVPDAYRKRSMADSFKKR